MDSDNITALFDNKESDYVKMTDDLNVIDEQDGLTPDEVCSLLDRYQFTRKIEMYFPELPQFIEDCYDD